MLLSEIRVKQGAEHIDSQGVWVFYKRGDLRFFPQLSKDVTADIVKALGSYQKYTVRPKKV